jgi:hypothetical protein
VIRLGDDGVTPTPVAARPGAALIGRHHQHHGLMGISGTTFDWSLCRSLLRLIARSEAIVRAARLELAVVIFMPSGVKVTTKYGSPSFGGSKIVVVPGIAVRVVTNL